MIPLRPVTIDVPDCPDVSPLWHGINQVIVGWGMAAIAILLLVSIIATGIVRYKVHEERTEQQRKANDTRIALARSHKTCTTCGTVYDPQPVEAE